MTLDQMLDRVEYLDITDMSKTTNVCSIPYETKLCLQKNSSC